MAGKTDNTEDRKRQELHKSPHTNMARQATDKTKESTQHQTFDEAFINASLKSAINFISPRIVFMVVCIS